MAWVRAWRAGVLQLAARPGRVRLLQLAAFGRYVGGTRDLHSSLPPPFRCERQLEPQISRGGSDEGCRSRPSNSLSERATGVTGRLAICACLRFTACECLLSSRSQAILLSTTEHTVGHVGYVRMDPLMAARPSGNVFGGSSRALINSYAPASLNMLRSRNGRSNQSRAEVGSGNMRDLNGKPAFAVPCDAFARSEVPAREQRDVRSQRRDAQMCRNHAGPSVYATTPCVKARQPADHSRVRTRAGRASTARLPGRPTTRVRRARRGASPRHATH